MNNLRSSLDPLHDFNPKLEEQFKRIFNDAKKINKDKPVVIITPDREKGTLHNCEREIKW